MKLRTALSAVALGVTVLTAVPATVLPQAAFAADCYTSCDPWDHDYTDDNFVLDLDNVPADGTPFPNDDVIRVIGRAQPDPDPVQPEWTPTSGGSTGAGPGTRATPVKIINKKVIRKDCVQNPYDHQVTIKTTASYSVSYKVSMELGIEALNALKLTVGHELNTVSTESTEVSVDIPAHGTWALGVEYQTVEYAITTTSWLGQNEVQYVTVSQPTGTLISGPCG
ncbi:DUF6426 family protein [Kitasatospora sp. NPDC097691]|uniref:DUF6426 family protein n=1 Tax=Kitasatospora sp. NPDC097691 TaxID=3157231 RepID=UPI0033196DE2